jgi:hypothetical protein
MTNMATVTELSTIVVENISGTERVCQLQLGALRTVERTEEEGGRQLSAARDEVRRVGEGSACFNQTSRPLRMINDQ